jgi:hypothetical protein
MANKTTNGSAETPAPTDTIPYDHAVREGQEIVLEIEAAERGQLRLGELADRLEPKYGNRTLAKFAAEIGVRSKCTLDRYRTVYRAWAGKLAPGPISSSYAVLRELAKHPKREQIIRENPNLTKREAHNKMRDHKRASGEKQKQDREDEWLKHNTPEQLETLLKVVDPSSLMYLRGAGRRLFNLANHLAELLGEEVEPFATRPIRRAEAEAATAQVTAN